MTGHLFEVATPLGFAVSTTWAYWSFLVRHKHPAMAGRVAATMEVLSDPAEIRRSRKDPLVFLFYRPDGERWLCAVAKRQQERGFLVTAYPTDSIKAGAVEWTRSR
jgi:hypothetical protein